MDRVSDVIDGARCSGRYTEDRPSWIGTGGHPWQSLRFRRAGEAESPFLCPLQLAVVEKGLATPTDVQSKGLCELAILLSLPLGLALQVAHAADGEGSDGVTLLRDAGY